jgi:hypothetical protein
VSCSITLVRQSTTVPKVSKTIAFGTTTATTYLPLDDTLRISPTLLADGG